MKNMEDEDPEAALSEEEKRALKKTRFIIGFVFLAITVFAVIDHFSDQIQDWIQVLFVFLGL